MKIKSLVLGLAAALTVAAPIGVSAAAAERVAARAVAPVEEGSDLGGGSIVLAVLAAAAVVAGIVILADGDDEPASA